MYEVLSEKTLTSGLIQKALQEGLQQFLGVLGMAKAGIQFMDQVGQRGILRTDSKSLSDVRAGLLFVKHINQQKVVVRTVGVSGLYHKAFDLCTNASVQRRN